MSYKAFDPLSKGWGGNRASLAVKGCWAAQAGAVLPPGTGVRDLDLISGYQMDAALHTCD